MTVDNTGEYLSYLLCASRRARNFTRLTRAFRLASLSRPDIANGKVDLSRNFFSSEISIFTQEYALLSRCFQRSAVHLGLAFIESEFYTYKIQFEMEGRVMYLNISDSL